MISPAKYSGVIRILSIAGLAVALTAAVGCAAEGLKGMLPWGGKKDYQPLEAREAAEQAKDSQSKPGAATSATQTPARKASWSPFGRGATTPEASSTTETADSAKKTGFFRNPFRRDAAPPADPFVEKASEPEADEEAEQAEEADVAAGELPAEPKSAAGSRSTGGRDPVSRSTVSRSNPAAVKRVQPSVSRRPVTTRAAELEDETAAVEAGDEITDAAVAEAEMEAEGVEVAEKLAEPLIRRGRSAPAVTRTAATFEEQKLQELDALISGGSNRAAKSASRVTSAALQKTETAAAGVQSGRKAVQRAAQQREDRVLQEFDELSGRAAQTEGRVRATVQRRAEQHSQLLEEFEAAAQMPELAIEEDEELRESELSQDEPEMEAVSEEEAVAEEAVEEAAEEEAIEEAAEDEFVMEEEEAASEEAAAEEAAAEEAAAAAAFAEELAIEERVSRAKKPAVAGAAAGRSARGGSAFQWQSGSGAVRNAGVRRSTEQAATVERGASERRVVTRSATLTRDVSDELEDLEEVDEWLTSPVAAPAPAAAPTGTRQRRIRQASMADPFVEAEASEAEMGDDSAGADDAEMQQDESTASPVEVMELPEPPDAGESVGAAVSPAPLKSAVSPAGGQAVEVAAAEAESEPTRDASIFSRLSGTSWVILGVGTAVILMLLLAPARRKAGTDGTAVIPA